MTERRRFWIGLGVPWTPEHAVADADNLFEEHGAEKGACNAAVYRTAYHPGTMGRLHWQLIEELLSGKVDRAGVLALPAPLQGWPSNPSALAQAPVIPPAVTLAPGPVVEFKPIEPTPQAQALAQLVEESNRAVVEQMAIPSRTYLDGRPVRKPKKPGDSSQGSLF